MSDFGFSYGQFLQAPVKRSKPMVNQEVEGRMGRMESDISYIKRDISDLKVDLKDVKTEMKDIRMDMRNDFRILFGAIIAVTLGLASIMAKGFGWL